MHVLLFMIQQYLKNTDIFSKVQKGMMAQMSTANMPHHVTGHVCQSINKLLILILQVKSTKSHDPQEIIIITLIFGENKQYHISVKCNTIHLSPPIRWHWLVLEINRRTKYALNVYSL